MGNVILFTLTTFASLMHASSDCAQGFTYHGCAVVDLSSLGNPLVFSDTILSPEACQKACKGHPLAALFPDCCRCGESLEGVKLVDDVVCDFACMNDPSVGMCGSSCELNISTVYTRTIPGSDPVPEPADSGVPVMPHDPEIAGQEENDPPDPQTPSEPESPSGPGDTSTTGDPPGRGNPPSPKSVNPNAGSTVPEDLGLPSPTAENGVPGQTEPSNNETPGGSPRPKYPGEPKQSEPSNTSPLPGPNDPNTNGPLSNAGPPGEAPEPLSSYPPDMDDAPPTNALPPQPVEDPDAMDVTKPQSAGSPPLPNQGNLTDVGLPPATEPWSNPSDGLITVGDPPAPSVITESGAEGFSIPAELAWSCVIASALVLG